MIGFLILTAVLGGIPSPAGCLPGEKIEVAATPAPVAGQPRLIPGYPPRKLYRAEYLGETYWLWGWLDTEGVVQWIPSENPHVPYVSKRVTRNFGVDIGDVQQRPPGTMTTNDPEFGRAFYNVPSTSERKPCPGPSPCPNPDPEPNPEPNPPTPPPPASIDLERWALPALMTAAAVGVVFFALRRNPNAPR